MIDWIIVAGIVLSAFSGWRHGLIRQIVSLVAVFVAFLGAKSLYVKVAPLISLFVSVPTLKPDNPLNVIPGFNLEDQVFNGIAFILMFLLIFAGVKLLGKLLDILAKLPGLSIINRISGLMLGLLLAVLISGILVNVLVLLPYEALQQALTQSELAQLLMHEFAFFIPNMQSA